MTALTATATPTNIHSKQVSVPRVGQAGPSAPSSRGTTGTPWVSGAREVAQEGSASEGLFTEQGRGSELSPTRTRPVSTAVSAPPTRHLLGGRRWVSVLGSPPAPPRSRREA